MRVPFNFSPFDEVEEAFSTKGRRGNSWMKWDWRLSGVIPLKAARFRSGCVALNCDAWPVSLITPASSASNGLRAHLGAPFLTVRYLTPESAFTTASKVLHETLSP